MNVNKGFQRGIIPYSSRLLVGVSGGADSMALLHLLFSIRHERALDLVVAHYDHALRRGSSRDASFVRGVAKSLGLRFVAERNGTACPCRMSVEDFARQKRFDFFVRQARLAKAAAVVLAHTQDDLAETVLMRILRGSGLSGLRSILPERIMHGVLFLRPMLHMGRVDVERFLKASHVKHIEDPTNAEDDFLRNRIRHKLIPYVTKEFAPAFKEKLTELALNAAVDYGFLEDELKKVLPRVMRVGSKTSRISLGPWRKMPQALRRMALREALRNMAAGVVSFQQIVAMERAGLAAKNGRIIVSRGIKAVFSDKFVTLS